MEIVISPHAKKQAKERSIEEKSIREVLYDLPQVLEGRRGRKIAQGKFFDKGKNKEFLIRVIFKEEGERKIVFTVYKTSKVKKYWKEDENENKL